jgi:hypothetical protein
MCPKGVGLGDRHQVSPQDGRWRARRDGAAEIDAVSANRLQAAPSKPAADGHTTVVLV